MPRRAIYESMPRGDLIAALCQRDRAGSSSLEAATDVAHRLELERLHMALDAAEAGRLTFADLFEHAPVAYCVLDRRCALVTVNAAACTLFGKPRESLVGAVLCRIVDIRERQLLEEHVARCLGECRRVSTELRLACNGRERTIALMSRPTGDGTFSKCGSVLVDVSGMKEAETSARRLAQCTEALVGICEPGRVADGIAHACAGRIADACFVDLVGRDVEGVAVLRRAAIATGAESVRSALHLQARCPGWSQIAAEILGTLTPVFEPDSAATLGVRCEREIGAASLIVMPLVGNDGPLGLLGLVRLGSKRTSSLTDLELAGSLARVAAKALVVAASKTV